MQRRVKFKSLYLIENASNHISTGESRYIVSRYLYPVIFLYPAPVILPFSLLPYWSIENSSAILLRVSSLFKLYLCNTALNFFKQRCIHRNYTSNLQINKRPTL